MGKKKKTNNINKKKETLFEKNYVLMGRIFSWFTLAVYLIGLPLYFKTGFDLVATTKYRYFILMSAYVLVFYFLYLAGHIITFGLPKERIEVYYPIKKLDIAMLAFLGVAFISHLFSPYKHAGSGSDYFFYEGSFYGANGWFMGFLTYFIVVCLYFYISRFLKYNDYIWIPIVFATTLVFIWGSINRFGYFPFHISTSNPYLLAPIGNINWFACYTSVMAPVIIGLYWSVNNKVFKILLIIPVLFAYIQVLVNGSDSGVFSFAVAMFVLLVFSLKKEARFLRFIELFALFTVAANLIYFIEEKNLGERSYRGNLSEFFVAGIGPIVLVAITFILAVVWLLISFEKIHFGVFIKNTLGKILVVASVCASLLFAVLIIINTKTGGALPIIGNSSFFIFDDAWGTNRGAAWKTGIMTFNRLPLFRKFIGVGPDMFYFALYDMDEVRDFVSFTFPGQRLTSAHNEIITLLVNMGIFGVVSFLSIVFIAFKEMAKRIEKNPAFIIFALSIVMHMANNQFSLEQIIGTPVFFVIISIGAAALVKDSRV